MLCAVCLDLENGMHCQDFCSGLLTAMAVYVGPNGALLRLPCLRWHTVGTCQDAGEARVAAGRQLHFTHILAAARIGPGALRGRSPRTREGRRPDRPKARREWRGVRREKHLRKGESWSSFGKDLAVTLFYSIIILHDRKLEVENWVLRTGTGLSGTAGNRIQVNPGSVVLLLRRRCTARTGALCSG